MENSPVHRLARLHVGEPIQKPSQMVFSGLSKCAEKLHHVSGRHRVIS